ncbi:unnamed protein product [Allacma fusca]|uniref:USP domain-containing protein n=1 Tax=Allacma fusca TaxID=39272 RepID=A0A8J2PPJ3_9HEXA|nr:unnamed protein product [Allacma fusca]
MASLGKVFSQVENEEADGDKDNLSGRNFASGFTGVTAHPDPSVNSRQEFGDLRSPEKTKDVWKPKNHPKVHKPIMTSPLDSMPLIPWGNQYPLDGETLIMINTCAADCTIQILYFLYTYTHIGKTFINKKNDYLATCLLNVFNHMNNWRFDDARLVWVEKILKQPINDLLNLWSGERASGTKAVKDWMQIVTKTTKCSNDFCPNFEEQISIISPLNLFPTTPHLISQWFDEGIEQQCATCLSSQKTRFALPNAADVIVYTCNSRWGNKFHSTEEDLAQEQIINNKVYSVVAYTLYTGSHYYAVLWHQNKRYTYDDRSKPLLLQKRTQVSSDGISSVWLTLK